MTTLLLRNLITYVATELSDMGASVTATKLVKLLYLVDVEHYRRRHRTLAGVEWVFYHYGPYAFEIETARKELQLDIPEVDVVTQAGHRARVFRPPPGLRASLEPDALYSAKGMVDQVLKDWGMSELEPLLDYVYFHTTPMLKAQRGQVLDFSSIKAPVTRARVKSPELPPDRLEYFRSRFDRARQERGQQVVKPLSPAPRFDDVYEGAARELATEELYSLPTGRVELAQEDKGRLRDQGEREEDA